MATKYKELNDHLKSTILTAEIFAALSIMMLIPTAFISFIALVGVHEWLAVGVSVAVLFAIYGVLAAKRLTIAACQVFMCIKDTADYTAETNERVLYLCRVAEFYGKRTQE